MLRRLLDNADRRLAVVMNEFGEIAVASRTVRGRNVHITELAGGCVCCSLLGEFEAAVEEIIQAVDPDLIVVETTGVAEPDALLFGVEEELPQVNLDSVVTVADADAMLRFPHLGYVTRAQFEAADLVLLNKVDLVGDDDLRAVEAQLRQVNAEARTVRCIRCDVPPSAIFGSVAPRPERPRPAERHGHLHDVDSFVYRGFGRFDRSRLESAMARLPQEIYRAKGFVRLGSSTTLLNYVAGRLEFEPADEDGENQVVFIGWGALEVREVVVGLLDACMA